MSLVKYRIEVLNINPFFKVVPVASLFKAYLIKCSVRYSRKYIDKMFVVDITDYLFVQFE